MNEMRGILERAVGSFSPDQDEGLEATLRRVRDRERHRRRLGGLLALAVFVAATAILALGLTGPSLLAGPGVQEGGELPRCWTFGAGGLQACRGDILDVAAGTQGGERWSLRVVSAVATPGLEGQPESALLCWEWAYGGTSSTDCLSGVPSRVDAQNRGGIIVDHSTRGDGAVPKSAYMGLTPAGTARITLSEGNGNATTVRDATLFGPFEQDLGTDAKLFLGFMPHSSESTITTVTAYDVGDNVLWVQEVPWFTD